MLKTPKPNQVPSVPAQTASVKVDSSVVLRLAKHSYEQFPGPACGQLLGVEDEDVLEVSHAFNYPQSANDNDGAGLRTNAMIKYQTDMITHLKEVNVDSNPIGYYMSSNMGKFYNQTVVENLLASQITNPESVLLVYDVTKSNHLGLALRAFRLSPAYLAVRQAGKINTENLSANGLSYHSIFQELPVVVGNSHLVTMYLHTLEAKDPGSDKKQHFDHLNISIDEYLEKNIEGIFDSVDDFHYDQGNYNHYQRQLAREKQKIQQWQQKRKAENNARQQRGEKPLSTEEWKSLFKLPEEPSRADNLLISAQLDQYCNQIEEFGAVVTPKLFSVQKNLEKA